FILRRIRPSCDRTSARISFRLQLVRPSRANGRLRMSRRRFDRRNVSMPARARLVSRVRLSLLATLVVVAALTPASITVDAAPGASRQLAPVAKQRAARGVGQSTVIVRIADRSAARSAILAVGGKLGRSLPGISSQVATVPNAALAQLAENDAIERISVDRLAVGATERTGATVGGTQI